MVYLIFSIVYFVLFGLLAFNKTKNSIFYTLLYVFLVLFWGCSYTYAPDVDGYMKYFYAEVKTISQGIDLQAHGFEEGFNLFAALSKSIVPEYSFFQFLLFATEIFLVIAGIRKLLNEEQARIVSVLLFFIYPSMLSATRQGVAVALIVYAIQFIRDRKGLNYFGILLIAFFFHHSSAIAAPLYFVKYLDDVLQSNRLVFLLLLVADFCWLFGISMSDYLDTTLATIIDDSNDFGKYSIFINKEETSISNYGIAKLLEINIAYYGFVIYSKTDDNYLLKSLLLLYTVIGLMLGGILAHRFLYYFIILYYVCMFIGVNALVNRQRPKFFLPISYILLAGYMFWFYIIKNDFIDRIYYFLPTGFQIHYI